MVGAGLLSVRDRWVLASRFLEFDEAAVASSLRLECRATGPTLQDRCCKTRRLPPGSGFSNQHPPAFAIRSEEETRAVVLILQERALERNGLPAARRGH